MTISNDFVNPLVPSTSIHRVEIKHVGGRCTAVHTLVCSRNHHPMIDTVLGLLCERIISKNVVAVTLAECLKISLEFFPLSFLSFLSTYRQNREESLKQNATPQVQSQKQLERFQH